MTISARWRKCARVAGALIQNTKALDVAAKLDDAAELLEIRHDAFEKLRSNFGEYALETQTAQEKTIFSQAEPDLMAHIITVGAWQLVDILKEPNAVEAFVSALTYKSVVQDCLTLRLIPQASLSPVEPVQRTLAWGFREGVEDGERDIGRLDHCVAGEIHAYVPASPYDKRKDERPLVYRVVRAAER